jgi:alcohol dehydrogenase (cytochrome c)
MTRFALLRTYLIVISASATCGVPATAADWPQWQGPKRNAVSSETGLLQEWPEGGPRLAWRVEGLGGGDSAPAVVNGRIYGLSHRDGKEIVWARSETDGKGMWASALGAAIAQGVPQSKEGPGGTPTIDGDRIYAIGMSGRLACLNLTDGKVLWQKSLIEDFGGTPPMWNFRESPLVDGNKVICTPGASNATLVALNKINGEVIWKTAAGSSQPSSAPPGGGRPSTGERNPRGGQAAGGNSGQRVFSFNVQGREFKDFDIFEKAGGARKAYIELVPVEVKDGEIKITFE